MYVCIVLPRPQDCEHAPRRVKAPTQFRFAADRGKNKKSTAKMENVKMLKRKKKTRPHRTVAMKEQ